MNGTSVGRVDGRMEQRKWRERKWGQYCHVEIYLLIVRICHWVDQRKHTYLMLPLAERKTCVFDALALAHTKSDALARDESRVIIISEKLLNHPTLYLYLLSHSLSPSLANSFLSHFNFFLFAFVLLCAVRLTRPVPRFLPHFIFQFTFAQWIKIYSLPLASHSCLFFVPSTSLCFLFPICFVRVAASVSAVTDFGVEMPQWCLENYIFMFLLLRDDNSNEIFELAVVVGNFIL